MLYLSIKEDFESKGGRKRKRQRKRKRKKTGREKKTVEIGGKRIKEQLGEEREVERRKQVKQT